jgi:hypothetical protein
MLLLTQTSSPTSYTHSTMAVVPAAFGALVGEIEKLNMEDKSSGDITMTTTEWNMETESSEGMTTTYIKMEVDSAEDMTTTEPNKEAQSSEGMNLTEIKFHIREFLSSDETRYHYGCNICWPVY